MGLFKSVRTLQAQAKEIERNQAPVKDRMAAATERMREATAAMNAGASAATAATAPDAVVGSAQIVAVRDTGTLINLAALALLMLLQPLGGWLSDIVGRKTLLVYFGIGGVLYTWVLVLWLPQQTHLLPAFGILALGFVILTGYTSINAVVKAELFPTHIRALGVGLGYALANSAFGGTAPLLYQASLRAGHVDAFVLYATTMIALSLVVYACFLTNKGRNWLDDEAGMRARQR